MYGTQPMTSSAQPFKVKGKTKFCRTKADGNCFFHAAFGCVDESGLYVAEEAERMRLEWFKFLSQYSSLKDVPHELKGQLEKIFNMFLVTPEDLTGRSKEISGLVSETNKSINEVKNRVQILKLKIATKFLEDETFKSTIYQIIEKGNALKNKVPPTVQELSDDNLPRLLQEIGNQLSDCVDAFDPDHAEWYESRYTVDPILTSFLEDANLFKNYVEAIKYSSYYVFFEEIPILASLAKTDVVVVRYVNENSEGTNIFKSNPALVGNYQLNLGMWGSRKQVRIYHKDDHFSHIDFREEVASSKRKATYDGENDPVKRTKLYIQKDTDDTKDSFVEIKSTSGMEEFLNKSKMSSEGTKFSAHGTIFQLKLLMLCLWRAFHNDKFERFRLATEMPEAGTLDDLAFQYESIVREWLFRLLQAKHKERENPQDPLPNIELKDLLSISDEVDFSLQKYFHSYLKINQRSHENSAYSVFSKSKIEDVVIITNVDVDPNLKPDKENGIFFKDSKGIICDSLFKTDKKDTCIYKIKLGGKEEDELKVIFKITSNFYRLISSLADHWCIDTQLNSKKQINKVEVFKEYYHPLRNEIIDVSGSKSRGYSFNLNKLIDKKSLDGEDLSAEAMEIRNALIIEMAFRKGNIKLPVIDSCELPIDETDRDNLAMHLANCIVKEEKLTKQKFKNYYGALVYHIISIDEKKLQSKFTKEVETPKDKQKEPSMLGKFKTSLKISLKEHPDLKKSVTNAYLEKITIKMADDFERDSAKTASGLAKNLVKAIKNNEIISILDFEDYHVGLTQEVVDIKTRTFLTKFINGHDGKEELSAAAKNLRRALIDEMYSENINIKIGDSEIAFQKFKDLDAALVQKLFGGSKIRVSEGFATDFHPNRTPEIDDLVLFAKQMQMLLDKEQKVVDVNCQMKAKLKMSDEGFKTFNSNIKKLAGYVFINRFRKIRFSTAFLEQSDSLPENVKIFIDKLKNLLGNDRFSSLRNLELKFDRDFETCDDGELFRKLPVLHTDTDVSKFFELLKFVVCYPNRFEIDDLLGEEVKDKIKKLDGKAFKSMYCENLHNWMADRVGTFYTPKKAESLFQEIQDNLSLWTIDGCNKPYFSKASQKFKFKKYNLFVEFLSGENQVLHLVFEDLALGRTRIVQTFRQLKIENASSMQKYTRGFGHIFLYLDQLNDIEFCSEINQVFANKSNFNLVVIECNTQSNMLTLFERLQTLLKNGEKIIFITTDSCDELAGHFSKGDFKKDSTTFDDIEDDQSKKRLFQEPAIILQNQPKKISFSELMCISNMDEFLSSNQAFNQIMSPETIIKLIRDETINIGQELVKSKGYDESYYIPRSFEPIILDEEKIQQSIEEGKNLKSDFFVISGTDTKLASRNVWVFNKDEVEPARIQFEKLCVQNPFNVHWLKRDSGKLIWNTSRGSVSNLRKYRERTVDERNLIDSNKLVTQSHNKIIIIADAAGTGKSTVLNDLSSKIKNNNPNIWVIRIDLNDLSTVLKREHKNRKSKKCSFNNQDLSKAFGFLVNNLLASQDKLKLSTNLEKEVLKNCFYGHGKIVLLIDGFDEIKAKYNNIVTDLLEAFKSSEVEKLVVTTRPIMKELLENRLGVFSAALKPFSKQNQIEFCTKFWTKKLELEGLNQEEENRLVTYAISLIKKFSLSIRNDKNFIAIPLHARMLAEIFQSNEDEKHKIWQGCKEFLNSKKDKTPKLPEKFSVCDLYERFVRKKYYVLHLEEKKVRQFSKSGEKRSANITYNDFINNHEILAMYRLFSWPDLQELLSLEIIQNLMEDIDRVEQNEGIIDDIVNNKPHFSHFTFADYFAANFVRQSQQDQKEELQFLIVTSILIKPDFKVLRTFLYEYKNENKLMEAVWDEAILKLLDTAYIYEDNTADDKNLLEKIILQIYPNDEHMNHLFEVLEEQGCGEPFMTKIITDSCFNHVIEYNFTDTLCVFIEKIDNRRLSMVLHDQLLEKLAGDADFCDRYKDEFVRLIEGRLTGPQLEELFYCPGPWDNLEKYNSGFIKFAESLLGSRSLSKVFKKYWLAIEGAVRYLPNKDSPTHNPEFDVLEQLRDNEWSDSEESQYPNVGNDDGLFQYLCSENYAGKLQHLGGEKNYAGELQHLDDEENDTEELQRLDDKENDDEENDAEGWQHPDDEENDADKSSTRSTPTKICNCDPTDEWKTRRMWELKH